jgi:hypothetical protein
MSTEITASPDTLIRQASMTVHDYMRAAKTEIDKVFGDGYAAKNPGLVGAFIQTCAADYGAAIQAKILGCALHEVAASLRPVTDALPGD